MRNGRREADLLRLTRCVNYGGGLAGMQGVGYMFDDRLYE